jgi:hypothetical protein
MKSPKRKMHKLNSVAIWVDVDTKQIFPCTETGEPYIKNGILLSDLNENWFNYLDREDKEFLSELVNNK